MRLVHLMMPSSQMLDMKAGSGGRNRLARMATYCCTLLYSKNPYPLERSTVRGLPSKKETAGRARIQPSPQPTRLSKARVPNSPLLRRNWRALSLQKK